MNAIRTFAEVKDHEVHLRLPESVTSKKVEVIIIPLEKEGEPISDENKLSDLQKLLLEAPNLSDEDYNLILEKRKALNKWN
jgi:hypothetical protein